MSDTHYNAMRAEAAQLRAKAKTLIEQASLLEARADTLDPPEDTTKQRRKPPEGQSVLNRWRRKEPQPGEVDDI